MRVDIDFFLDAVGDEACDDVFRFVGGLVRQKVEVRAFDGRGANALVDFCRFVGDVVSAGLAENVLKARAWNHGTAQQVVQHIASSHAGELVGIAHEHDPCVERSCFEERGGKPRIDHTEFIDDEQIALEAVVRITVELAGNRVHFEQPVDGARFFATAFAHALGRTARGGGEAYAFFHLAGEVENPFENRRLAGARPARDNGNLSRERHLDGASLNRVETEFVLAFPLRKVVFEVVRFKHVVPEPKLDVVRDSLFRVVEWRKIAIVAFALDAARFTRLLEFVEQNVDGFVIVQLQSQILDGTFQKDVLRQIHMPVANGRFL